MAARTWSGSTGATLDTGVATASATLDRHPVAPDLPSATGSMLPRLLSQTLSCCRLPGGRRAEPDLVAQHLPSSTTARARGLGRGAADGVDNSCAGRPRIPVCAI